MKRFVDILYLGRIFPKHAAIMAKKSIKMIPGLGWFSQFVSDYQGMTDK